MDELAQKMSTVMRSPEKKNETVNGSAPASPVKASPFVGPSLKRQDYLSWTDYFMSLAIIAAQRSKDPTTQVGAVIVNDGHKVIGTGYNGMPIGCDDDLFPWGKQNEDPMKNKHTFVCHAEMNAILNSVMGNVARCTIYTVLFPCNECAKLIVQCKIKEVVYMLDRESWEMNASRALFRHVGIPFRKFRTQRKTVTIHFDASCYENDDKFDVHDA